MKLTIKKHLNKFPIFSLYKLTIFGLELNVFFFLLLLVELLIWTEDSLKEKQKDKAGNGGGVLFERKTSWRRGNLCCSLKDSFTFHLVIISYELFKNDVT